MFMWRLMDNKTHSPQKVIDVRELRKVFDDKAVVDGISLEIHTREIFGFLGPNGSGKTTTIRMLCGLLTPDGGEGTCLGYDAITQARQIKLNVGYMTQTFSLYGDLTVYENIDFIARMFDLRPRREVVQASIDRLKIGRKRQN